MSHRHTGITRRHLLQAGALLSLPLEAARLSAQEVLKILVGFPAGGAIDTTARVYADAVVQDLGPAIVENKAGAAGNIAATALAQARADGNSLMFAPVNVYCISQALYRNLAFNAARDFAPMGVVARFPWVLAVHAQLPVTTVAELVQWIKANPGRASCGMAAIGSEGHLMAYALSRAAGVDFNFVAYKGGAPMAQDLMAGHIPFAFDPIVNLAQPHKAGKVRILATTSADRNPLVPEVPTFREAGFPVATGDTWIGAAVRSGTPPGRAQAITAALAAASRRPELRSRLAALGLVAAEPSPDDMARTMVADAERYTELVKAIGLRVD